MDQQNEQGFYQTGHTHPAKNYRGIITLLLITIVLLATVVTVLGIMNIHLFHQLSTQPDTTSVQFSPTENSDAIAIAEECNNLGLSVTTLSDFDREFYQYPQGVYITNVAPNSRAEKHGVLAGDILISIQNVPTADTQTLDNFLNSCAPGQPINLVIFRDGEQHSIDIGE